MLKWHWRECNLEAYQASCKMGVFDVIQLITADEVFCQYMAYLMCSYLCHERQAVLLTMTLTAFKSSGKIINFISNIYFQAMKLYINNWLSFFLLPFFAIEMTPFRKHLHSKYFIRKIGCDYHYTTRNPSISCVNLRVSSHSAQIFEEFDHLKWL